MRGIESRASCGEIRLAAKTFLGLNLWLRVAKIGLCE